MTAYLEGALAGLALSPGVVAILIAVVLGAAVLRGFTGFGFAIAAVPLLSQVVPPLVAVTMSLCMQTLGGLIDLRRSWRDCHRPSLRWLLTGALAGSPAGMALLGVAPASIARIAIGGITLIAAVSLARGAALAAMPGKAVTLGAGLLAGIFSGLAAMPGPPAVAYYLASPVSRVQARASMLVFFFLTSTLALASALWLGLADKRALVLAVIGMPVMVLGVHAGNRASRHGGERTHRLIAIALLVVIAVSSIARGGHELWP